MYLVRRDAPYATFSNCSGETGVIFLPGRTTRITGTEYLMLNLKPTEPRSPVHPIVMLLSFEARNQRYVVTLDTFSTDFDDIEEILGWQFWFIDE